MLMFMSPSLVSVIPCNPNRLNGPPVCGLLLEFVSGNNDPILDFGGGPHGLGPDPPSVAADEFDITGLLWTLMLGDTARRLNSVASKSSSRARLRLNSCTGVGCCGALRVELRELGRSKGLANSVVDVDGVMSIARSSSEADDAPG